MADSRLKSLPKWEIIFEHLDEEIALAITFHSLASSTRLLFLLFFRGAANRPRCLDTMAINDEDAQDQAVPPIPYNELCVVGGGKHIELIRFAPYLPGNQGLGERQGWKRGGEEKGWLSSVQRVSHVVDDIRHRRRKVLAAQVHPSAGRERP